MSEINPVIIETQDLCKEFNGTKAVDNLNLKVRKNSIFGFLGPNGAGKTTTIKLLLGLVKPTSGTARVFDDDITKGSLNIRSRVGYLPQNPYFYENMTARENLEFSLKFYFSGPKIEIKNRVNEVLALVNLEKKADRSIKGFSGGERQRLGIAQAIVHYPDLLILDEPAASLDPIGRNNVLELMSKLREVTTIFYSTHILDDVQKVSDTVAILNNGKLIEQGPIEELLGGGEGLVYVVKLKGNIGDTPKNIVEQDWISNLRTDIQDGKHIWFVSVSNEKIAEEKLLRTILENKSIKVIEFYKKKVELEEVFLKVVEDDKDV